MAEYPCTFEASLPPPAFGHPSTEEYGVEGKNCPICHLPNKPCLCDDDETEEMFSSLIPKLSDEQIRAGLNGFSDRWLPELNDLVREQPDELNEAAQRPPHTFLVNTFLCLERFFLHVVQLRNQGVIRRKPDSLFSTTMPGNLTPWTISHVDPFAAASQLAQIVEVGFEILSTVRGTGLIAPSHVLPSSYYWQALSIQDQWELLDCFERWRKAKIASRWFWNEEKKKDDIREFHEWQEETISNGTAQKHMEALEKALRAQEEEEERREEHTAPPRRKKRADGQTFAQATPAFFPDRQQTTRGAPMPTGRGQGRGAESSRRVPRGVARGREGLKEPSLILRVRGNPAPRRRSRLLSLRVSRRGHAEVFQSSRDDSA